MIPSRVFRWAPALWLLLLAALPATAQIASDRPGFGDGSAVMAPNRFQVETGYAFSDGGAVDRHAIGQVLLRLGVAPGVELRGAINSYVVTRGAVDESGFEDVSVGAKVNLVAGDGAPLGRPNVTLIAAAALPTGSDAFSGGVVAPQAKLALDWGLSGSTALSVNAGYAFTFEDADANQFFTYVALGTAVPGAAGLGAFAGLYSLFPHTGDSAHGLDGGLTFLPAPDTQLDVSVGLGLTAGEPDVTLGFGIAHVF